MKIFAIRNKNTKEFIADSGFKRTTSNKPYFWSSLDLTVKKLTAEVNLHMETLGRGLPEPHLNNTTKVTDLEIVEFEMLESRVHELLPV